MVVKDIAAPVLQEGSALFVLEFAPHFLGNDAALMLNIDIAEDWPEHDVAHSGDCVLRMLGKKARVICGRLKARPGVEAVKEKVLRKFLYRFCAWKGRGTQEGQMLEKMR